MSCGSAPLSASTVTCSTGRQQDPCYLAVASNSRPPLALPGWEGAPPPLVKVADAQLQEAGRAGRSGRVNIGPIPWAASARPMCTRERACLDCSRRRPPRFAASPVLALPASIRRSAVLIQRAFAVEAMTKKASANARTVRPAPRAGAPPMAHSVLREGLSPAALHRHV